MRKFALTALLVASQVLYDPAALTAKTANDAVVDSPADSAQSRSMPLLDASSTVGDILDHPAFAGFARLILPWDGKR
jgi:hypothetical protein